ncbi:MAG: pentapeptide repeat-containing protein, partial [Deltaproteobacteria bacterium]|nr:pentapeptide repeat-containing protein [Deltaproteobacteria bacterium]
MALSTDLVTVNMTAAAMAANPSSLSGRNITCDIDGDFVLENAVIKRATFTNSKIWRSTVRNVTFENCTFSRTQFMSTTFENVTFKGGSVSYRSGSRNDNEVSFEDVRFINVVVDGVSLNEGYFQVTSRGGNLTLKNLTNVRNKFVSFYIGNSKVVMDNCKANGELFAVLSGERTTVYVNNCEFVKYSGIGGNCKSLYINNSKFLKFSYIGGGDTTVIENSVL